MHPARPAIVATDGLDEWDVREALSSLVAKSMLGDHEAGDGTTRYRLLETLRQYALERLDESSDLDTWRRRHAEHYADWAETCRPGLLGPDELDWLVRLEAESDNLRVGRGLVPDPGRSQRSRGGDPSRRDAPPHGT